MMQKIIAKLVILFLFVVVSPYLLTQPVQAAKLVIEPPTGTYSVGQQFQSKITLDTEGVGTAGVDVLLKYDPALLKITNVQEGEIYNQYLGKKIDNDNGLFGLSGIVSLDDETGFTGAGTFATVVFEGISPGAAAVDFDFSPGVRSDSNVAPMSSSDDSLSSATGANYTIVAGSGENKGGLTEPTPVTELPKSGVIGDTLKLVGVGLGAIIISLLLL